MRHRRDGRAAVVTPRKNDTKRRPGLGRARNLALADRVVDQVKQLPVGLHKGVVAQLGVCCGDIPQFIKEADLALAALAHEFFQPISLLPAMQAVLHLFFLFAKVGSSIRRTARS